MDFIVTPEESGLKLLTVLVARLEGRYSARFLKRLVEQNCCQINGRTDRFASTVLGKGDRIHLHLEEKIVNHLVSLELTRIVFEDASLLLYNKPAGINCDEQGILQLFKSTHPTLQLVHRLDRDTTGILILSKRREAFERLVQQFKALQVLKSYLTIVDGRVEKKKGVIENYLGKKHEYAGQTIWGKVSVNQGLYACTEWESLQQGQQCSLIACKPKTGRTHQIRVHMAEMGHPILGDFQYGKQFQCSYHPPRMLLHAQSICFHHPLTGKEMFFSAPLPEDIIKAELELFGKSGNHEAHSYR